jgi:hypothetical protein
MTLRVARLGVDAIQAAPHELDADIVGEFDAFIRFLLRAQVQVTVVLPPIHPEALRLLRKTAWAQGSTRPNDS